MATARAKWDLGRLRIKRLSPGGRWLQPRRRSPEIFQRTAAEAEAAATRLDELRETMLELEAFIVSAPIEIERQQLIAQDVLPPPDAAPAVGAWGAGMTASRPSRRVRHAARQRKLRRFFVFIALALLAAGLAALAIMATARLAG